MNLMLQTRRPSFVLTCCVVMSRNTYQLKTHCQMAPNMPANNSHMTLMIARLYYHLNKLNYKWPCKQRFCIMLPLELCNRNYWNLKRELYYIVVEYQPFWCYYIYSTSKGSTVLNIVIPSRTTHYRAFTTDQNLFFQFSSQLHWIQNFVSNWNNKDESRYAKFLQAIMQ
jgi:hypothetical protein